MSHDEPLPDPARIVLARRIEWIDTDAAGIYPVDVEIAVVAIGRTSLDYRFTISARDGQAAEGSVKACFIDTATGRAVPWPDEVRERLAAGGLQDAGR
ncbi:MAG TPA: thioesterase family protein [Solirubrobacteraceae bacterium]|nr:thioesterase family protein [Solirubrobacteraceae bacterium]